MPTKHSIDTDLVIGIGRHAIGHCHQSDGQVHTFRVRNRQAQEQQERLEVADTESAGCFEKRSYVSQPKFELMSYQEQISVYVLCLCTWVADFGVAIVSAQVMAQRDAATHRPS